MIATQRNHTWSYVHRKDNEIESKDTGDIVKVITQLELVEKRRNNHHSFKMQYISITPYCSNKIIIDAVVKQ